MTELPRADIIQARLIVVIVFIVVNRSIAGRRKDIEYAWLVLHYKSLQSLNALKYLTVLPYKTIQMEACATLMHLPPTPPYLTLPYLSVSLAPEV